MKERKLRKKESGFKKKEWDIQKRKNEINRVFRKKKSSQQVKTVKIKKEMQK